MLTCDMVAVDSAQELDVDDEDHQEILEIWTMLYN